MLNMELTLWDDFDI